MLIKRATKTKGAPKRASVPLIANQGGTRSGGQLWEADWQAQNEAACAEICRTGNCSTCRTQSLPLLRSLLLPTSCAWARRDCGTHARGILMCKVQHHNINNIKSRARPLFAQTQPRLKDSFLRFIILYNSPYAVLFIATHAKHCTPCSEINWKAIKTLVYLLLRFFSRICCMYFVKYFNIFCCSPHCTKLPKWQKRFCSAQPNGFGFEFGWGIGLSAEF